MTSDKARTMSALVRTATVRERGIALIRTATVRERGIALIRTATARERHCASVEWIRREVGRASSIGNVKERTKCQLC
jgi:hypothetical protein